MNVIERILEEARRRDVSQSDLERQAGLPMSRISKWKNGQGEPSWSAVLRLARLTGLSVAYLARETTEAAEGPTTSLTDDDRYILRTVESLKISADEAVRRIHFAVPEPRDGEKVPVKRVGG